MMAIADQREKSQKVCVFSGHSDQKSIDEHGKTLTERFSHELPFVDAFRRQSLASEHHVDQSCLASPRKSVASREGLSQSTVKEIFNYWAALKQRCSGPGATRALGIDVISLKQRHKQFALVISDITRKCILAVLPDREKRTLEHWMDGLSREEREAVCFVSIDMWAPYQPPARNNLPHTDVVVDRFHVMKQLDSRLTQLRTEHQKGISPKIRSKIKVSHCILVRNRSKLAPREEEKLKKVLELGPELRSLYLLREEFRRIFENIHCGQRTAQFLFACILKAKYTDNKYLVKFITTLRNSKEEMLNYFIEGVTNGFFEGLNGPSMAIMRNAFGYRNFVNFMFHSFAGLGAFRANPR